MIIRSNIKQTHQRPWITTVLMMICALLLTACSLIDEEESEVVPVNYNPVKSLFSVSVSGQSNQRTRMTSDIVQNDNVFRGMQNIYLIPFDETPVSADATAIGNRILLPMSGAYPSASADNSIDAHTNSYTTQYFQDVDIPNNTAGFLFYGEKKTNSNDLMINGKIIPEGLSDGTNVVVDDITFRLQPIASSPDLAKLNVGSNLATYLTTIVTAHPDFATTNDVKLHKAYQSLTLNQAGSSATVLALVQDLYTSIFTVTDDISEAVKNAILSKATESSLKLTFNENLLGYPGNIGLPDGAAYMNYDSDAKEFQVNSIGSGTDRIGDFGSPKLENYTYPASLYYKANSSVKTATTLMQGNYDSWRAAQTEAGASTAWADYLDANYTDGDVVDEETHSVALTDEVNYAVARLDMTVKANASTVLDHIDDQSVERSVSVNNLVLTGVLVGSQNSVDYNFSPNGNAADSQIIYDQLEVRAGYNPEEWKLSESETPVNYTLVMPTRGAAISVALEFINNDRDFLGVDGQLIPKGCKFYLVGSLDQHGLPDGSETLTENSQIFMSDNKTIVHFTVTSLANAYNVVPDLREAKFELGLTVNLNWQKGILYNDGSNSIQI